MPMVLSMAENILPRYMRKKNMTPEQLEAKLEAKRKYAREWARANKDKRWARMKERMAADPEYRAKVLEQSRVSNAKRRANGLPKRDESSEERERRLHRQREYRAKKRRDYRLANSLPAKPPKKEKPKANVKSDYKRKPGRLLALSGWRGC